MCGLFVMLSVVCSRQFRFFHPCFCGVFGGVCCGDGCGGALTGVIHWRREPWLVFLSVSYCV
jgi:hypothetical protein